MDINRQFVSRIIPETLTGFRVPPFSPPPPGAGLSLIFTKTSSQYLTLTGNAGTNQQKSTFSTWFKLNTAGSGTFISFGQSNDTFFIGFNPSGQILVDANVAGTPVLNFGTNNSFNDVTAWHHFLLATDTTQATAADRMKLYVDNVLQAVTGTLPSLNQNISAFAQVQTQAIGVNHTNIVQAWIDGKLAQTYYIDGQQLTPSSFASGTPLIPITYTGTYTGVFSFFLDYSDPTSLVTLGLDRSGQGNNWTLVNMAVSNSSNDYPPSTPPPINFSLIFNGTNERLTATGSTSINQQKFTFAAWFKRSGTSGASNRYFYNYDNNTSNSTQLLFDSSTDQLEFFSNTAGVITADKITSAAFTDTTSWHHICLAVDTTQATADNRVRIYYDGTEIVSWSANGNPAQNTNLSNNFAHTYSIGCNQTTGAGFFNGNMAGVYYIDGQQLTPSNFITGTPGSPKTYTGTYTGVFSYFLPFYNGTSTTTLGYDYSGIGTNWTLVNMTVSNQSADHP